MSKTSKTHAVAINKLMLPLIATVAHASPYEDDLSMFKMYADDMAHNIAALCVFNSSLDAAKLHDNIMRQDTAPREHFHNVLVYIETNKLIATSKFCCI